MHRALLLPCSLVRLASRRAVRAAVCAASGAERQSDIASGVVSNAPTPGARLKAFFGSAKLDKQKLAALGASALLAYGFVSNVNAVRRLLGLCCCTCLRLILRTISVTQVTLLIISWVGFAQRTGLSPLAPGQWKLYLLSYTALYAVIGNALRPIRFSISVAITPVFDRFVAFLQSRLGCSKPVAFGVCVFLVNVCGTCTYLALGLRLVTLTMGLPLLPN